MAISTALEHSLASLGNVPSRYRHEWRVAKACEPLVLPDAVLSGTRSTAKACLSQTLWTQRRAALSVTPWPTRPGIRRTD